MTPSAPLILTNRTSPKSRARDRWRPVRLKDAYPIVRDILKGRITEVGGEANRETESRFRELTGCKYVLATNSGTAALHSAYFAVGVGPGDEVIMPSYTFFATGTPLFVLGAKPVFCEIDPETLTIDPIDVEKRITPKTKAICAVHVWGNPANLSVLQEISQRRNIPLIEDCSHAHGATFAGRSVGSFGAVGCFSMQGSKAVSGGEAGVVVTNDAQLYDRMLVLGHNGRTDCDQIGSTFSLGGMSYGVKFRPHLFALRLANSSMQRLPELNRRRTENWNFLAAEFGKRGVLTATKTYSEAQRGGFLEFIFNYHPEKFGGWSREAFVKAVNAEGFPIGVDRYSCFGAAFRHLHEAAIFTSMQDSGLGGSVGSSIVDNCALPVTETICRNLVSLPAFTTISRSALQAYVQRVDEMAEYVCQHPDVR